MDEFYVHGLKSFEMRLFDPQPPPQFASWWHDDFDPAVRQLNGVIEPVVARSFFLGRYYIPVETSLVTDARFVSAPFDIWSDAAYRSLPPPAPYGSTGPAGRTFAGAAQAKEMAIKLYGAQWTSYAEEYDSAAMEPVMYDYSREVDVGIDKKGVALRQGKPSREGHVKVSILVYGRSGIVSQTLDGGGGGLGNSGYSPALGSKGGSAGYYLMEPGDYLRYKVIFRIMGAEPGKTTLLATPVFDDITIFYSQGIELIAYAEQA